MIGESVMIDGRESSTEYSVVLDNYRTKYHLSQGGFYRGWIRVRSSLELDL